MFSALVQPSLGWLVMYATWEAPMSLPVVYGLWIELLAK